jgi:Protein of unknown function (DUF2946)
VDDIVKAALAKWPNVPHCYGWLALDSRGDYYMRDDPCQAAGAFQTYRSNPGAKGSRITHDKLLSFIYRNYSHDERGAYFFQNGPQRVYVELMDTPFVLRVGSGGSIETHTQEATHFKQAYVDETGRLFLDTTQGFGLVHTQDMVRAEAELTEAVAQAMAIESTALPAKFSYVISPQSLPKL